MQIICSGDSVGQLMEVVAAVLPCPQSFSDIRPIRVLVPVSPGLSSSRISDTHRSSSWEFSFSFVNLNFAERQIIKRYNIEADLDSKSEPEWSKEPDLKFNNFCCRFRRRCRPCPRGSRDRWRCDDFISGAGEAAQDQHAHRAGSCSLSSPWAM